MSAWINDFRIALRIVCKNLSSTTVATLSLALSIGVGTALFSLADNLLFRNLPVREPERLFLLDHHFRSGAYRAQGP